MERRKAGRPRQAEKKVKITVYWTAEDVQYIDAVAEKIGTDRRTDAIRYIVRAAASQRGA